MKKAGTLLSFFFFFSLILKKKIIFHWDFSCGPVVKNPPANAGDTGSIHGLGRSHLPECNQVQ